jgi:hypothetical protein
MSANYDNGYLLIFRGTDWHAGLSPEQMQQVYQSWLAWFNRLKQEGKCAGGNPLEGETRVVSGKDCVVSDGPFAEAKESIGGYFLLTVGTLDEAVAIAKGCPGLPHGIRVEVRPIAPECPMATEARTAAELAHA